MVSVIIPTYNGGKHLLDAVNSALLQTYAPIEIIVVDDGSQEDITQVLSPVLRRLTLIRQDNAGPAAARNNGVKAASGEFIAFLDDDDLWHPTKIEVQMRAMSEEPDCGLVYSYPILIDENGSIVLNERPKAFPSGHVYYDFLQRNRINTPSVTLVRKSALKKVGGFDENRRCISCEDYDLWLRIAREYKVKFCDDANIYYRQSKSSISKNNYNHLNANLFVMSKLIDDYKPANNNEKMFFNAVSHNLHYLFRQFAYKIYYDNNDIYTAKVLMAAALRKKPWILRDLMFLLFASLPATWFEYFRNLKRNIALRIKHDK